MDETTGVVGLYLAYVAAETLRPRLPRAARILDFGDRRSRVAAHLEASGATVVRGDAGAVDGAFAEIDDWKLARPQAAGLAARLAPGAPVMIRLRRAPAQPVRRVLLDLGPAFLLRPAGSLGLFVPADASSGWAERYPQAFGALCALEGATRSWPLLRDLGREALLLGALREAAR
jgi:hypothetical protein